MFVSNTYSMKGGTTDYGRLCRNFLEKYSGPTPDKVRVKMRKLGVD